jgi:hypothetical protein
MSRGLSVAVPFFVCFGGFMFVYAVATQQVLGWSPLRAGLGLTPMALSFLIASLSTSRLLARFGQSVLTAGLLIQAAGYVGLAATVALRWDDGLGPWWLAPSMLVAGLGQGLVMSPVVGIVLAQVPLESAGVGGGVLVTSQQTALAVGATAFGTLFTSQVAHHTGPGPLAGVLLIVVAAALGCAVLSRRLVLT